MSGEIVLIIGYPAAGKSTLVKEFVDQGYHRVNRDEMGGTLHDQAVYVGTALQKGQNKLVLDNTYPTVKSRRSIIETGQRTGVPVRCVWLDTSFEDAQFNACMRMVERCQKVLHPEDFKKNKDPNLFPPAVLFKYRKEFQEPTTREGFFVVEKRKFKRVWPAEYKNKALLLDYDETLRRSTGPNIWPEDPGHVEVLPGRKEKLLEYAAHGYRLLGISTQSAIANGLCVQVVAQCFQRTNELLGIDQSMEYMFCPHKVPPVSCYCRKPQSGIGAYFIWKHKLDPAKCIFVGDQTSDRTFSKRCGFRFEWAKDFF